MEVRKPHPRGDELIFLAGLSRDCSQFAGKEGKVPRREPGEARMQRRNEKRGKRRKTSVRTRGLSGAGNNGRLYRSNEMFLETRQARGSFCSSVYWTCGVRVAYELASLRGVFLTPLSLPLAESIVMPCISVLASSLVPANVNYIAKLTIISRC